MKFTNAISNGNYCFRLILLVISLLSPSIIPAQGAIVNEFSNGTTGSQEYFELVVIGPAGSENCGPVDLRGFAVDDNNGDFSGGAISGAGIASGHIRFSPTGPWGAIPTGAILLIYNSGDKNPAITLADDPLDTSPHDSVYVIPDNFSGLEGCTTTPNSSSASYTPCTFGTPSWLSIGLRNAGDAAQVRDASMNFFHGLSFGNSPMTGGPLGINIPGAGGGMVYSLTNSAGDNYLDPTNFGVADASVVGTQTPGRANTANNLAWINSLTLDCLLPVSYAEELSGEPGAHEIRLFWETATETNSREFVVERSQLALRDFEPIARISASGNSTANLAYEVTDFFPKAGPNFYRLRQIDLDGRESFSKAIAVEFETSSLDLEQIFPNPTQSQLNLVLNATRDFDFRIMDLNGREVFTRTFNNPNGRTQLNLELGHLVSGLYIWEVKNTQDRLQGKLVIR
ncbi:MAG: T9SS type A sorting domain-containing protein [Bacteroidia bacterium]|nr:T9SS type A sorting domain-containing protein [Bacteroidia bacterium]